MIPMICARDDLGHPNRNNIIDIIRDVSKECYMPITVGEGSVQ